MSPAQNDAQTALITGANRGLGLAMAQELLHRGIFVIASARSQKGLEHLETTLGPSKTVLILQLDVTDENSIKACARQIDAKLGKLDILINNAGILPDNKTPGVFEDRSLADLPIQMIRDAFETNTLGVIRVSQAMIPLLKKSENAQILNISSLAGQLTRMESGIPAYQISKTALNAVTRILADELKPEGITCNSISPGFVRTDMGGQNAHLTPEESAKQMINFLLSAPEKRLTGRFIRDGEEIPW